MKKNTLRLMAVIAAAFIFLGCEFVLPEYRVTYSTEHGIAPYSIKVVKNNVLTQEQLPELKVKGYTFNGWVNSANNRQVTAGYRIVEDLNLKALWTKSETDSESKPDVPNNEQNPDNSQEEIDITKLDSISKDGHIKVEPVAEGIKISIHVEDDPLPDGYPFCYSWVTLYEMGTDIGFYTDELKPGTDMTLIYPFTEKDEWYGFYFEFGIDAYSINSESKMIVKNYLPDHVDMVACKATNNGLSLNEYFDISKNPAKASKIYGDKNGKVKLDSDITKFIKKDIDKACITGDIEAGDAGYENWLYTGTFYTEIKGKWDDYSGFPKFDYEKLLNGTANALEIVNGTAFAGYPTWFITAIFSFVFTDIPDTVFQVRIRNCKKGEEASTDNFRIDKTKISDYVTITKTQADITAVLPENIGPNPFAGNTYRYEYSFDNGYQVSTYSVDLEFIDENTFLLDGEEYTYSYVNTSDKHKLILKPEKITATEWENSHCTYENTQELVHQEYDGEVGEELYSYAVYREFNSCLYFEYELNGDILKLKQVMPDTIEEYLSSLSPADDVSFQEEIGDGCFEWFDEYGIGNFSYTFNEREYEFCPLEVKDGAITYIQLPPYGAEYSIAIIPYEYYPEEGKLILTYGGNNHTYILNQNDFQEFNKVN